MYVHHVCRGVFWPCERVNTTVHLLCSAHSCQRGDGDIGLTHPLEGHPSPTGKQGPPFRAWHLLPRGHMCYESYRSLLKNLGEYRSVGTSVLAVGLGSGVIFLGARESVAMREVCAQISLRFCIVEGVVMALVILVTEATARKAKLRDKVLGKLLKSLLFVLCARSDGFLIRMAGEVAVTERVTMFQNISVLCYCRVLHAIEWVYFVLLSKVVN